VVAVESIHVPSGFVVLDLGFAMRRKASPVTALGMFVSVLGTLVHLGCTGSDPVGLQNDGGSASATGGKSTVIIGTSSSGGGSQGSGGSSGRVASTSTGGATGGGCDSPSLNWNTANKTNYTSYPDPGSEECVKYSGCLYEGLFAACDLKRTQVWVQSHNIVSVFPDFSSLKLHDLCLKSGSKSIIVTVLDECADSDCGGCCTANQGSADELIDIESYTDQRWGVQDGPIQWADLGPTTGSGCN